MIGLSRTVQHRDVDTVSDSGGPQAAGWLVISGEYHTCFSALTLSVTPWPLGQVVLWSAAFLCTINAWPTATHRVRLAKRKQEKALVFTLQTQQCRDTNTRAEALHKSCCWPKNECYSAWNIKAYSAAADTRVINNHTQLSQRMSLWSFFVPVEAGTPLKQIDLHNYTPRGSVLSALKT